MLAPRVLFSTHPAASFTVRSMRLSTFVVVVVVPSALVVVVP
jgi:hypothetical protein